MNSRRIAAVMSVSIVSVSVFPSVRTKRRAQLSIRRWGVEMLALDRPQQVGHFLRRIGERIKPPIILYVVMLDRGGAMVEPQLAVEGQDFAAFIEGRDRHRIAENVLKPAQFDRLGVDYQGRVDEMLVVTFARTHHDPVVAEGYGLSVSVGRDVREVE